MTSTVLVIGASGKTGRRLVAHLYERGMPVKAASRNPGEGQSLFDWNKPETYGTTLAGVEAIYLIPPALVEDPAPLTGPFLMHAKKAGVRRVLLLSSLGVEFPHEPQDSGRRKLEQQVIASGLDWTILRPSGFAQNFSESFLLPGILHADTVASATGDGAVAFVDAGDIAAVAAKVLADGEGHVGKTYAITGPAPLTFADAAEAISKAAGRRITYRQISSDELLKILTEGIPADYAAMVVRDQQAIREGAAALVTDVVERITGRPATPFVEFAVKASAAWSR